MTNKSICVCALVLTLAAVASAQVALNPTPSREIGHPNLPKPNPFAVQTTSPNLVEGRELYNPSGLALDTSVSPPLLYVSDTNNNRVLAWKNAAAFSNGAKADLVIGQKDFFSTFGQAGASGPGPTGLSAPTGLAVFQGDLYVADSGNNRILRFRKPFSVPSDQQQIADMVIGQSNFNSQTANAPTGVANTNGIALAGNNSVLTAAITFDKNGNLWLTDSGNSRVLRYDAADVAKGGTNLTAKLEIGQLDYGPKAPNLPQTLQGAQTANQLATPNAIAFDSAGRLYIADGDGSVNINRVLVFLPPFTPGMSATRIMGVYVAPPGTTTAPADPQLYSVAMFGPSGIFFLPGTQGMGVIDSGYHRILLFNPYDSWPDVSTSYSPVAKAVFGHASGLSGISSKDQKSLVRNDGNPQSSANTFSAPQAAVLFNNELFVADAGNNRVVVLPVQNGTPGSAVRLLGQDRFDSNSINLIEGREFQFVGSISNQTQFDSALAIDSTGDTPHLYVSDPYNHRVLGFRDMRNLKAGIPADIVIGQPDFSTAVCNYPTGDPFQPTQSNLCRPLGLLVDSAGNLYVADSLNGRVVRFPAPFSHVGNQSADLVLGQSNFVTKVSTPDAHYMGLPYGLAFAGNNGLLVSDQLYNRVLYFPFTNGGFTSADNGKAATKVIGQPDFFTSSSGAADNALSSPKHISADTDGRPYVADTGNGRVVIFDQVGNLPASGAHAALTLSGGNGLYGIYVSPATGEVWVADVGNNRVVRYPKFDALQFNPVPLGSPITSIGPLAVTQDQFGDLIVAERSNRVTFYYPGLTALNGANFALTRPLAPNTFASVFPVSGGNFGKDTADYTSLPNQIPLPKSLADVQVLMDGVACPLTFVSPGQINFIVPWNQTISPLGADVQVTRVSTGQLLAAGTVAMNDVSPGIFQGAPIKANTNQAAVLNKDNTPNGPTNPAARGDVITIFGTGQGYIDGAPADGDLPKAPLSTSYFPRVAFDGVPTDSVIVQPGETVPGGPGKFVLYSGTSFFPGVWQINVQIPMATNPNAQVILTVIQNSLASNGLTVNGINTVIFVGK